MPDEFVTCLIVPTIRKLTFEMVTSSCSVETMVCINPKTPPDSSDEGEVSLPSRKLDGKRRRGRVGLIILLDLMVTVLVHAIAL